MEASTHFLVTNYFVNLHDQLTFAIDERFSPDLAFFLLNLLTAFVVVVCALRARPGAYELIERVPLVRHFPAKSYSTKGAIALPVQSG